MGRYVFGWRRSWVELTMLTDLPGPLISDLTKSESPKP